MLCANCAWPLARPGRHLLRHAHGADARRRGGWRYWRYIEVGTEAIESGDLEILRRIDPSGGVPATVGELGLELERAWQLAVADIVEAHNARADLRAGEEPIGPRQRWALEILRDPGVAFAAGADLAEEALSVGRGSAVRRALGEVEDQMVAGAITPDDAALRIVAVVTSFGLQPVAPAPLPTRIVEEDVGVVCWMAVLPPGQG